MIPSPFLDQTPSATVVHVFIMADDADDASSESEADLLAVADFAESRVVVALLEPEGPESPSLPRQRLQLPIRKSRRSKRTFSAPSKRTQLEKAMLASTMREKKARLVVHRSREEQLQPIADAQRVLQAKCVVRCGHALVVNVARNGSWRLTMCSSKRRRGGQNVTFVPHAMLQVAFDP